MSFKSEAEGIKNSHNFDRERLPDQKSTTTEDMPDRFVGIADITIICRVNYLFYRELLQSLS